MRLVDLRSDTVTKPTEEMRQAMARAEVGDDVYGEDPTVRKLEELAAEKLGKEAGLFLASGTMANAVAILTHTSRGDEVLLEAESHIYTSESGGMAVLAGVMPRLLKSRGGHLVPHDIVEAVRPLNIHYPRPRLLCLENTHNSAGGVVIPPDEMEELCKMAKRHNLSVHLDGARIFNAAVALGVDVKKLVEGADSVMFCLSKGLSAPVGSVLVGRKDWIGEARRNRKLLGGGMRQAGVIAAAGIVALETMIERLAEDHENARLLADRLINVDGVVIEPFPVETNIVMMWLDDQYESASLVCEALAQKGVLAFPFGFNRIRFVTHKDVTRDDILYAVDVISKVLRELSR